MTSATTEQPGPRFVWGSHSGLGLAAALVTLLLDQASKLWLLNVYDIRKNGAFVVTPFLNVVENWNKGISYGLLQQDSEIGQWALIGLKFAVVIALWVWMTRVTRWSAACLGLVIGGAIGNAIDGLAYRKVFDFIDFHISSWDFHWYVFNLADVAIVVGVAGLMYESLFGGGAVKAPRSGA